jgi:TATA-box binding protein (TBP) (component of TFIID and TFIIIB)
MEFSDLRISTMTCSASLRGDVDLDRLFEGLTIVPDNGSTLGISLAIDWRRTHAKPEGASFCARNFGKNVTVKLWFGVGSSTNMKVFHNGGLQMTGIKTEAGGREASQYIAGVAHDLGLVSERDAVDFRVRMINSDMRASVPLQRGLLYEAWRHERDLCLAFDPLTYPALKLLYFFPPIGTEKDGVCRCQVHCSTKLQAKHRRCLKATVSLFESGCIIITGSVREEHVYLIRDKVKARLLAMQHALLPRDPDAIMQAMLDEHRAHRSM